MEKDISVTEMELDISVSKRSQQGTPNKQDKTRRKSSILKPPKQRNPLTVLDFTAPAVDDCLQTTIKQGRRVSFASNNFVKEFATDHEKNTIWDSTYEEELHRSDHSDDQHVANEIQSQTSFFHQNEPGYISNENESGFADKSQYVDNLDSCSMEITGLIDGDIEVNIPILCEKSLGQIENTFIGFANKENNSLSQNVRAATEYSTNDRRTSSFSNQCGLKGNTSFQVFQQDCVPHRGNAITKFPNYKPEDMLITQTVSNDILRNINQNAPKENRIAKIQNAEPEDMLITQPISNVIIRNINRNTPKENKIDEIVNTEPEDMLITRPISNDIIRHINQNTPKGNKFVETTNEEPDDMVITRAISNDILRNINQQFQENKVTEFQNNEPEDMLITQAMPSELIRNIVRNIPKTTSVDELSNDGPLNMLLTRAISNDIIKNLKRNTPKENKIAEDINAEPEDMLITRPISNDIIRHINRNTPKGNKFVETTNEEPDDMVITRAISNDILRNINQQFQENTVTEFKNMEPEDMLITQAMPSDLIRNIGLNISKNDDPVDMLLTRAISNDILRNIARNTPKQNEIAEKAQEEPEDMLMTRAISNDIIREINRNAPKQNEIVEATNEKPDDMEITRVISNDTMRNSNQTLQDKTVAEIQNNEPEDMLMTEVIPSGMIRNIDQNTRNAMKISENKIDEPEGMSMTRAISNDAIENINQTLAGKNIVEIQNNEHDDKVITVANSNSIIRNACRTPEARKNAELAGSLETSGTSDENSQATKIPIGSPKDMLSTGAASSDPTRNVEQNAHDKNAASGIPDTEFGDTFMSQAIPNQISFNRKRVTNNELSPQTFGKKRYKHVLLTADSPLKTAVLENATLETNSTAQRQDVGTQNETTEYMEVDETLACHSVQNSASLNDGSIVEKSNRVSRKSIFQDMEIADMSKRQILAPQTEIHAETGSIVQNPNEVSRKTIFQDMEITEKLDRPILAPQTEIRAETSSIVQKSNELSGKTIFQDMEITDKRDRQILGMEITECKSKRQTFAPQTEIHAETSLIDEKSNKVSRKTIFQDMEITDKRDVQILAPQTEIHAETSSIVEKSNKLSGITIFQDMEIADKRDLQTLALQTEIHAETSLIDEKSNKVSRKTIFQNMEITDKRDLQILAPQTEIHAETSSIVQKSNKPSEKTISQDMEITECKSKRQTLAPQTEIHAETTDACAALASDSSFGKSFKNAAMQIASESQSQTQGTPSETLENMKISESVSDCLTFENAAQETVTDDAHMKTESEERSVSTSCKKSCKRSDERTSVRQKDASDDFVAHDSLLHVIPINISNSQQENVLCDVTRNLGKISCADEKSAIEDDNNEMAIGGTDPAMDCIEIDESINQTETDPEINCRAETQQLPVDRSIDEDSAALTVENVQESIVDADDSDCRIVACTDNGAFSLCDQTETHERTTSTGERGDGVQEKNNEEFCIYAITDNSNISGIQDTSSPETFAVLDVDVDVDDAKEEKDSFYDDDSDSDGEESDFEVRIINLNDDCQALRERVQRSLLRIHKCTDAYRAEVETECKIIRQIAQRKDEIDAEMYDEASYIQMCDDQMSPNISQMLESRKGSITFNNNFGKRAKPVNSLCLEERILKQQERNRKSWKIISLNENIYRFETLYGTIVLAVTLTDCDSGVVENLSVESRLSVDSSSPLGLYSHRNFMKNLDNNTISRKCGGENFNVETLMDYIQLCCEDVAKSLETLVEFDSLYYMKMDRNFTVTFEMINFNLLSAWKVTVDLSDEENITPDCVSAEALEGTVNEQEIKKLAQDCPKGTNFLRSFVNALNCYIEMLEDTNRKKANKYSAANDK